MHRPRKQNENTQSPALQLRVTTHLNLGGGPGDCNPAEESLHIVRCLTRRKVMQKRNLSAVSLLPDASLRVHVLCLHHSMHTQRHVGLALSARESCISRIDERKEHNHKWLQVYVKGLLARHRAGSHDGAQTYYYNRNGNSGLACMESCTSVRVCGDATKRAPKHSPSRIKAPSEHGERCPAL